MRHQLPRPLQMVNEVDGKFTQVLYSPELPLMKGTDLLLEAQPGLEDYEQEYLWGLCRWRFSKSIYVFDRDIESELLKTPLDNIPADILARLPEWSVYIKTNCVQGLDGFFFTYSEENLMSLGLTKAMQFILLGDAATIAHTLPITTSLEEALTQADSSYAQAMGYNPDTSDVADMLGRLLALVVYLCSEEPDMEPVSKPQAIKAKKKKKGKRPRFGVASHATERPVAVRLGAAFRKAKALKEQSEPTGAGKTPVPHVRKAHFHKFWRGPKQQKELFVKWLPPILVAFGDLDLGEQAAVVRPVKGSLP